MALRQLDHRPPGGVARHGYLKTFPQVLAAPRAPLFMCASTCYASSFFCWITYLAAAFTERFGLGTPAVAAIWTVNAGAFCLGSLVAGRSVDPEEAPGAASALGGRLLLSGLLLTGLAGPGSYLAPSLEIAIVLTLIFSLGDGLTVAGIVRLLLSRYPDIRGAVLGLNGAANHFGIFLGTGAGGLALGLASYTGIAVFLGSLSLLALTLMLVALRSPGAQTRTAPPDGVSCRT